MISMFYDFIFSLQILWFAYLFSECTQSVNCKAVVSKQLKSLILLEIKIA